MNRLARSFVITLGALVVLALASCSAGGGKVTLTVWDTGLLGKTLEDGKPDMAKSFLDQAAADFTKENPNIEVKVVQQGGDITANNAQFQAASIAKTGPDLRVQYPGGGVLSYGSFFVDLNGKLDATTIESMTGWNTVREGYKPDGKLWAMPYGAGLYFTVFENRAMVSAAGLDPDKFPTTWEEMLANGKTIKAKTGKNGFFVADLEGYVGAWVVGGLLGGELGETVSTDMFNGTTAVNDAAMVKVYKAWADFGASGLTNPDGGTLTNGESTAGFVQEKGAYYIVGSWENGNMQDKFGPTKVSTFFLPMLAGAKNPTAVAGGPQVAVSITNYSKHQDEALLFLKYLARPEIQDKYVALNQTESSNHIKGNPALLTNSFLRTQAEQLKAMKPVVYPFDNVMPQPVIDLFYKMNAAVFLGKVTPQEAADQLEAANKAEIANRK